jgi:hypothetical protein
MMEIVNVHECLRNYYAPKRPERNRDSTLPLLPLTDSAITYTTKPLHVCLSKLLPLND